MSKTQQTQMFQLERDEAAGIITRPFDGLTLNSQIRQILDWQVEKKIPQYTDFCNEQSNYQKSYRLKPFS